MQNPTENLDNLTLPRLLYGTAWKEERTQRLTELALQQGFRGIDTANQRKHYDEAAVGRAIASSIDRGLLARNQLFLQSKFTFRRGQDHRLPYDPESSIPVQVEQSFASSLVHLGTDWLDCYVLHGPSQSVGWSADDGAAWRAMEAIHDGGRVRWLGVSNVSLEQLQALCGEARIPPRFVQNRCYAARIWDQSVRTYCAAHDMLYQGFSLLTANQRAITSPLMVRIAKHHGRTVAQIVFRFAADAGMIPLTGTASAEHMRDDLEIFDFQLGRDEVEQIEWLFAPRGREEG